MTQDHRTMLFLVLGVVTLTWIAVWRAPVQPPARTEPITAVCTLTLAQQVARADLILTGAVFAVLPSTDVQFAQVFITPDQWHKGQPPANGIRIVARSASSGSEANTGDLHFATGQPPALLFLHQRDDGQYTTGRCFGSRVLTDGLTEEEKSALNVK